jgi:hypothetical protein
MIKLLERRQCGGLGLALLLSARIEAARESTRVTLYRSCSPCNANSIRPDEFSFVLASIQVIVRFLNSS